MAKAAIAWLQKLVTRRELETNRLAVARCFDRRDEQGFALSAASTLAAGAFPSR